MNAQCKSRRIQRRAPRTGSPDLIDQLVRALEWALAKEPSPCRCFDFATPPHVCVAHMALAAARENTAVCGPKPSAGLGTQDGLVGNSGGGQ